jgi:chromosome segregation ATPase
MIDKRYIESAKEIRTSYIRLAEELNKYQGDVEILSNFLSEKIKDLEKINEEEIKKIKNKEDISKISKKVLDSITEIEDKEKFIGHKVSDINTKIERLKKDEIVLYNTIKAKYPQVPIEVLREEIQKHLDR